MDILFLGTSSGWPFPRLGCNCNICTSNNPKDKRLRPSLLINGKILIDAPPDIYLELTKYKVNPTYITHIILTHSHDDHIMGLYDLSHIYGKRQMIEVVSTEKTLSIARSKLGVSMLSFKNIKVKPLEKYEVGRDASLWLIPVNHTVETFAIKIKAPRPIVYAPEFRKIPASSQKEIGDIDLAVIDGSSKTAFGQAKGHETIEEGIRLAENIKAKKIVFTNIGHKTDTHEELIKFVKERGGYKFDIAFDGLLIRL